MTPHQAFGSPDSGTEPVPTNGFEKPARPDEWAGDREKAFRPLAVRLGLELVVVFVGVYAAFALSQYENRREGALRREQLEAALVREIQDITSNTRRVASELPVLLARFDSAVAAGARPPLRPWIEPVRVQTHMWEATLQSGALDFFEVPTVYRISEFYNELNAGFEQLSQLRELSETVLIPALGLGSDEFYDEKNRLRPKYTWYRDGLGRLARLAATITTRGDSLVAALSAENGEQ
jgi:hypothetical protein